MPKHRWHRLPEPCDGGDPGRPSEARPDDPHDLRVTFEGWHIPRAPTGAVVLIDPSSLAGLDPSLCELQVGGRVVGVVGAGGDNDIGAGVETESVLVVDDDVGGQTRLLQDGVGERPL